MGKTISITIRNRRFTAELNDSQAAVRLLEALPLKLRMSRWGEEYYGDCGLRIALGDSAREIMEVGEIAYWPPGSALCFFFGPTPASKSSISVARSSGSSGYQEPATAARRTWPEGRVGEGSEVGVGDVVSVASANGVAVGVAQAGRRKTTRAKVSSNLRAVNFMRLPQLQDLYRLWI